jgi:hypothetical protein
MLVCVFLLGTVGTVGTSCIYAGLLALYKMGTGGDSGDKCRLLLVCPRCPRAVFYLGTG